MFINSPKLFLTALLLTGLVTSALCQQTEVTGVVKDGRNKLPLPYVTVSFKGSSIQTKTDQNGSFKINSPQAQTMLQLDYIGYKRLLKAIRPNRSQDVVLQMTEESQQLTEVKITAGKSGPYRNKNNPAVELI